MMCTFILKDMLCVLQFKQMHYLQIVVIQNMTLHCSLYDLEKYSSLEAILFLLKLNASNVLKVFTQELSMYFNQI